MNTNTHTRRQTTKHAKQMNNNQSTHIEKHTNNKITTIQTQRRTTQHTTTIQMTNMTKHNNQHTHEKTKRGHIHTEKHKIRTSINNTHK